MTPNGPLFRALVPAQGHNFGLKNRKLGCNLYYY